MTEQNAAANRLWLWDGKAPGSAADDGFRPWLEPYLIAASRPCGAVIVCPGGGYGMRAAHEAEPIARRVNRAGYHAFVLQYRVAPHRHPAPLFDAARAVRLVRARAKEWNVNPSQIAIGGFSAGGHLTASLGVLFREATPPAPDAIDRESCRPDALILCYPVISSGEFANVGSFQNLLGPDAPAAAREQMSLEQRVTAETPPAFLWHTADDAGVPMENSLLFAMALRRHKIPVELHVYPFGPHGVGLAESSPHLATWSTLCSEWLAELGWVRA